MFTQGVNDRHGLKWVREDDISRKKDDFNSIFIKQFKTEKLGGRGGGGGLGFANIPQNDSDSDDMDITSDSPTYRPHAYTSSSSSSIANSKDDYSQKGIQSRNSVTAARLPTFHASELGPWCAMITYEACIRLCHHRAKGGIQEARYFLNNEFGLLQNAFDLEKVLLQPEEKLLARRCSDFVSDKATTKPKKTLGKIKVQVRKVRMGLDPPPGCNFSYLGPSSTATLLALRQQVSSLNSAIASGWGVVRKVRVSPHLPANSTFSQHSLAYLHASTQYVKQVTRLLKNQVTTSLKSVPSSETMQETYPCLLRLKSSPEDDVTPMQPGSGESHVFFPEGLGDDLFIEVRDSKGKYCGRVQAQVAAIADDPTDKLRWWPIYHEPEHELVGRVQLYINYSTSQDESTHIKSGTVAETVSYDFLLEVAMKVQNFQQRNLLLHGPWKWLVTEYASYYGVADAYTKLRYLSYVMDVATPTKDCLDLVHNLLLPVLMKGRSKSVLSHQEVPIVYGSNRLSVYCLLNPNCNRILGEVDDQIQQILALAFENYKSLDEKLPSGVMDVFAPATGLAAPALAPAIKLYCLLHDINPEAQLKLCRHFQAAAKKRSKRHLTKIEEFMSNEGAVMDPNTLSTYYQKMKVLILSFKNEISTDIEIHDQDLLPSFLDLPNLSASIYSVELSNKLRTFFNAYPPPGPSPPVVELVLATSDFQRDLSRWNISHIKGGIDAKEMFNSYITRWIQDKRLALLESCKLDKVKWSGVKTQHSTTPYVDDMYDQLKETLKEYEVIISRWPEYTVNLENAIADVERAILEALDKQYADVLGPLKDNLTTKFFNHKYVQKLAKGTVSTYVVPDELGTLLNSMKRMLDVLRPKIESKFKSWGYCIPDGGGTAPRESVGEITVTLRAKFRNLLQAVSEKLAENTRMQNITKLKKIIEECKEAVVESDLRARMQPLKDMLIKTIDHLHTVVEPNVFIAICRGFWDRMGQDVLRLLENSRENRSSYKGARIAVSILDEIFTSQMQQLLGNELQERDVEAPRSIVEVRSMLCKDSVNYKDNNYF
ncbi:hypothetical protein ACFE04_020849 [Oxalis oulophora]